MLEAYLRLKSASQNICHCVVRSRYANILFFSKIIAFSPTISGPQMANQAQRRSSQVEPESSHMSGSRKSSGCVTVV